MARTTLMTFTLLSPAPVRMTVELGLLFGSSSTAASSRSGNGNSGSSSGNAKLLFHFLDQFGQFENGHASDCVENFSFGNSHDLTTPE